MKDETRAKLNRMKYKAARAWREWGKPMFEGATIAAAWLGWSGYIHNSRQDARMRRIENVVDNNATVQQHDRDKMLQLEHQQTLLFERALRETEGKTE